MKSMSQCFDYEECFETLEEARAEIRRLRSAAQPKPEATAGVERIAVGLEEGKAWHKAAQERARERALPWVMEGSDICKRMTSTELIQALYSHEINALNFRPAPASGEVAEAGVSERDRLAEYATWIINRSKDRCTSETMGEEDEENLMKACEMGIGGVRKEPYNPDVHQPMDCEPGDMIWSWSQQPEAST